MLCPHYFIIKMLTGRSCSFNSRYVVSITQSTISTLVWTLRNSREKDKDKKKKKTNTKVTVNARTMQPNTLIVQIWQVWHWALKNLVKNPSDVLVAIPERIQLSLLEGFGWGLTKLRIKNKHKNRNILLKKHIPQLFQAFLVLYPEQIQ